ncbi:hypothetical protein GOV12_07310 [Candidatus Pacearchaeota archaeon]|nr:hypothetical protein [Candidatus Pacearchaeota archaeon]
MKWVKYLVVLGILLFNISLALSQTIDVDYPMIALTGDAIYFNITLNNFSEDIYDVKVEILDLSDNSTKLSETWDGEKYQTSYRYVNDLIDSSLTNEGKIKVNITTEFEKVGNVIFRLRDSDGKTFTFSEYELHIVSLNTTDPLIDADPTDEEENDEDDELDCEVTWDENDIINGEEFSVEVECLDLLDKDYDLKVYIYDDNKNSPISQTYLDDKFLSSIYYVEEIIIGPDSDYATIDLRIKESDRDFSGDCQIGVKIRESVSHKTVFDDFEDIEIIEAEEEEEPEDEPEEEIKSNNVKSKAKDLKSDNIYNDYTENVIRLKTENIKTQKNKVYLSKNRKIMQYSIIIFIILIVLFIVLLLYMRKKK